MLVAYAKVIILQGVGVLAGLLTAWQVSLHVEPTALGQYSLYLSLIGAGSMLLINWPNAALLRFAREEWRQRNSLGETLATRGLMYLAGSALAVVLAWLLDPLATRFLNVQADPLPWLAVGVLVVPLADMGVYANQAADHSLPYGYVPLISGLTVLLGIALIPALGVKAEWNYLVAWILGGAAAAGATAFCVLPRRAWRGFRASRPVLVRILRYSWAIPLGSLAAFTVNWVDAWVIRFYMGNDAVGLYTWAYRVTAVGSLAFGPLGVLLTPAMVDARVAGDLDRINRHGRRSLRVMLLAGIAGLCLLAGVFPLMALAIGPKYHITYLVILILLSPIPFQLLGYLMNPIGSAYEFLIPKGMLINVVVAIGNVIGDFLLVPRMGIFGAALATGTIFSLSGLMATQLILRCVPGLRFPRFRSFAAAGLLMPLGALCLWAAGPAWGAALCAALGIGAVVAARRLGLFSHDDALWLETQPIAGPIKRPLVRAARWFAGGKDLAGAC